MGKSVTIEDIVAGMPISGVQREGHIVLSGCDVNVVIGVYRGVDGGSHGMELNFMPVGNVRSVSSTSNQFIKLIRALGMRNRFKIEAGANSFSVLLDELTDIDILMLERGLNVKGADVKTR